MSIDVYTKIAGTMSESFVIGKRGVKLLQGIGDPAGILAPVGSLYFRKDGTGGFYQMSSGDTWLRLLTPENVTYVKTFTNSDLSSGILTATHGLGIKWPHVSLWNDSDEMVVPDKVTSTSTTAMSVDLTSFGTITGTWHLRVSL